MKGKAFLCMVLFVMFLACGRSLRAENAAETILALSGIKGGVCVHLECTDGSLMLDIAKQGTFLVQGTTSKGPADAQMLRKRFAEAGFAGIAGVWSLESKKLPYAENMVNLLVVDDPSSLADGMIETGEIARVLVPGGVVCFSVTEQTRKQTAALISDLQFKALPGKGNRLLAKKPFPDEMDDWTHWNHGPDGNLVSQDRLIERPNQLKWIAGPVWGSGRRPRSVGDGHPVNMRSAGGRNYYIMGKSARHGRSGSLLARDAFNGVMLWANDIQVDQKQVIASGDELYVYHDGELKALDGANGKPVRTYGKVSPGQILLADGLLVVCEKEKLRAFDAAAGKEQWTVPVGASKAASKGGRLFYQYGSREENGIACLDLKSGENRWKAAGLSGLVFAFDDKLLLSRSVTVGGKKGSEFTALAAKDGKKLWSYQKAGSSMGYYAGGRVWLSASDNRQKRDSTGFHSKKGGIAFKWLAIDPEKGKVVKTIPAPVMLRYRCHPLYATERFFVGNRPIYFTEWETGKVTRFEGTRLACQNGCGLAQGMFYGWYSHAHLCMCLRPAISGVTAFTSDRKTPDGDMPLVKEGRLIRGDAEAPAQTTPTDADGWPMYRHDIRRSGSSGTPLSSKTLSQTWRTKLLPPEDARCAGLRHDWALNQVAGDSITQAAAAGELAFVSLTHAQQVAALDSKTGKIVWRFHTPARMDAPPAIHKGLCIFGCRDGRVYCVRADNGRLVWRFRAAPADRLISAFGQLESAWPITSGVLIEKGLAYVIAGRTPQVDGGLYVHALDAKTGKLVWTGRHRKESDGAIGPWNLKAQRTYSGPADLLSSDGKTLAIASFPRGRLKLADGKEVSGGGFDVPYLRLMQSRFYSDRGALYPPIAFTGSNYIKTYVLKKGGYIPIDQYVRKYGPGGWKVNLPRPMCLDAVAAAGTVSVGSATRPKLRVAAATTPPVIDGSIDRIFLEKARPQAFGFLDGAVGKPREATTGYLLSDSKNLYLAFRCEKPEVERVVCKRTKRDDGVWQDECIELFIDPFNTRRSGKYFHIIINPAGVIQDARNKSDTSWNPNLEVACGRDKGAWTAEIRIPFAAFGLKPEEVGKVWSFNMNRSARDPDKPVRCEDTAWAPTNTDTSHVPGMFGYLWLDGAPGGTDDAACAAWKRPEGATQLPVVRVPEAGKAPKVDGRIDEIYTQQATALNFVYLNGTTSPPREKTTGYILSDRENLYLAVRCEKKEPERVVCRETRHDGEVWQDEAVEFFIDPKCSREFSYFHIMVNAAGVTCDMRNKSDKSWEPKLTVRCGREAGKAWICELKIPFAELGVPAGKLERIWSVNITRSARDPDNPKRCEDTAWAPTHAATSHMPDKFGCLWLNVAPGGEEDSEFATWKSSLSRGVKQAAGKKKVDGIPAVLAAVTRKVGEPGGELWVLSNADGSVLSKLRLETAAAYDGLSIAGGRVFVALQDGSLACLEAANEKVSGGK